MSSGMPELGSKISLVSKADIRYEGRLFTVDPQECTIALASVRSFGTEDRETQYPVAPQSQVYDYILFRGSDIKDIRVVPNVPSLPNDPAIMQMSVPPTLGGANPGAPGSFAGQFNHPVVGQTQYPQYHPMAGFPGSVHTQLNKTSELSPQTSVELAPQPQPTTAPIGSGVAHHSNQVKDQGSMLDLIGGSQQSSSRSNTPAVGGHRKSPTADQGTQAGVAGGSGQRDSRRGSTGGGNKQRNRTNSRTRQRYPSGGQAPHQNQNQHHQQNQHQQNLHHHQNQHHQNQHQQQNQQMHHHQQVFPGQGYGRGGWRGRGRGGRGRGFVPRNKNTLKFDNDYDFEQANTEFEELRSQLAKTKISEGEAKPEITAAQQPAEVDKKDDSGNETGAGEAELDDDANFAGYDRKKSFFDSISCETVERSKGRSQRTDWRTERKLNAETFGVASARRGAWRGRPAWRHHNNPMQQPTYFPSWRPMRGGRGRPGNGQPGQHGQHANHSQHQQNNRAPRPTNTAPAAAAAQ
ncbi:protein LSM14 homolog B-B isoform X2 [Plodia interpunctella]|uniref:protein LSM14 homolog B-B isoform X2 n=1 Tax=Plodia interpunctella TaxID=58824 RepID=UPI0023686C65|nr:protein LSM14 homolog B-B isoform X2 [Plodia interpunctella]